MTYVRVTDLPATWADYEPPQGLLGAVAHGLIAFVAGPTEDGIRTVELWASRDDWVQVRAGAEYVAHDMGQAVRELEAPFTVTAVAPGSPGMSDSRAQRGDRP